MEGVFELLRRACTKIQSLELFQTTEKFLNDCCVKIIVNVLLSQELLEVWDEVEALKNSFWNEVAGLSTFASCPSSTGGVEVGEIETPNNASKRVVLFDTGEELGEYAGVRDGNVSVKCRQGGSVHGT